MTPARQFLRFAAIGVLGFAVDVGVLYLAAPVLGWYGARVLSFVAAASATWALNRRLTFAADARGAAMGREYLGYLLTMLGGALVNYTVYVLTLHWLAGPWWVPGLGVALGSIAGLGVNFLAVRHLVFRDARGRR